ncbi:hypothetical protein DFJ73DRAFT_815517 [Zopfochytrium polystomum]|nr:hypothetical protein DFJ73DRAFT_815517 [Zopfochytrium polystomum]
MTTTNRAAVSPAAVAATAAAAPPSSVLPPSQDLKDQSRTSQYADLQQFDSSGLRGAEIRDCNPETNVSHHHPHRLAGFDVLPSFKAESTTSPPVGQAGSPVAAPSVVMSSSSPKAPGGPVSEQLFCYCRSAWEGSGKRFMLRCDLCREWFHGDCLTPCVSREEADRYAKFHCPECTVINGPSIMRPPPVVRPQRETRALINYSELNRGVAEDERRWAKVVQTKRFSPNKFPYMNGEDLTVEWARRTGLREPVIVEEPDGLEMTMPPSTLTVDEVADLCGRDRIIEAMEVSSQLDKQMTLDEWANYFRQTERKRLMNVISLEISQTPLGKAIVRPRIVRDLDWIDHVWPPRSVLAEYPAVQLYCLMSVKDCYTDFHIDFGGSSVFYHLLSGQKIFYFVRPTPVNLKKYERWSSSPDQSRIFFGDEVKECIEVTLHAGNTMIIPAGWIHAVYTPKDSVVIGGNFVQGLHMGMQLQVQDIENKTGVPPKFRFPHFVQMQWFAASHYLNILRRDPSVLSKWELDGLRALSEFLAGQEKILSQSTDRNERRTARQNVPTGIKNVRKIVRSLKRRLAKMEAEDTASKSEDQSGEDESTHSNEGNTKSRPKVVLKLPPKSRRPPPLERDVSPVSSLADDDNVSISGDSSNDASFDGELDWPSSDSSDESASSVMAEGESGAGGTTRKRRFKGVSGWKDNALDVDYVEGRDQHPGQLQRNQTKRIKVKLPKAPLNDSAQAQQKAPPLKLFIHRHPSVNTSPPDTLPRSDSVARQEVFNESQPRSQVPQARARPPPAAPAKKPSSVFNRLNKVLGKLKYKK